MSAALSARALRVSGTPRFSPGELAPFLNGLVERFHRAEEIRSDPLGFSHRFQAPGDQEVVAFMAAAVAWGRVSQIASVLERLLSRLGGHPADRLRSADRSTCLRLTRGIVHRTATGEDLAALLFAAGAALRGHGTLEGLFMGKPAARPPHLDLIARLEHFATSLRQFAGRETRGVKHLLPLPGLGSACKRWMLFLRWVVRPRDGVDLGLWHRIAPADLLIPLDTHLHRISLNLGLTRRRDASLKTVQEITGSLRLIRPEDPTLYDFALARLGIDQICPTRIDPVVCCGCGLKTVCRHGLTL